MSDPRYRDYEVTWRGTVSATSPRHAAAIAAGWIAEELVSCRIFEVKEPGAAGMEDVDLDDDGPDPFDVWMAAHPGLAGLDQVTESYRDLMPEFLHAMATILSRRQPLSDPQAAKAAPAWSRFRRAASPHNDPTLFHPPAGD